MGMRPGAQAMSGDDAAAASYEPGEVRRRGACDRDVVLGRRSPKLHVCPLCGSENVSRWLADDLGDGMRARVLLVDGLERTRRAQAGAPACVSSTWIEGHEVLLGAVVQIALDPAPLSVGGGQRARRVRVQLALQATLLEREHVAWLAARTSSGR